MTKLPTINIRKKEYFINERLQELRSKVYIPDGIEFIPFSKLNEKEMYKVSKILSNQKEKR